MIARKHHKRTLTMMRTANTKARQERNESITVSAESLRASTGDLALDLTPGAVEALSAAADAEGMSPEEYASNLLEQELRAQQGQQQASGASSSGPIPAPDPLRLVEFATGGAVRDPLYQSIR